MSVTVLESRASRSSFVEDIFDSSEYSRIGQQYEALLAEGFAQTAHAARDLMYDGATHTETWQRINNELSGMAIEKLGEPFVTEFEYSLRDNKLIAENGERFKDITARGLRQIKELVVLNPGLDFLIKRRAADDLLAESLEAMCTDSNQPIGACRVVASACPDARELGIPRKILEDNHFQPDKDQAMVWVATKTAAGLKLQTINLFHAAPERLAHMIETATDQPYPVVSREATPWIAVNCIDQGDMIDRLRSIFDEAGSASPNQPTFHGLSLEELKTEEYYSAEKIVEDPEFIVMQQAACRRIEEMARSLISGQLQVPRSYIEAILQMSQSDSSLELDINKQLACHNVLTNNYSPSDLMTVIKIVQRANEASLWATISKLYHKESPAKSIEFDKNTTWQVDSGIDSSIAGLSNINLQRAAGRQEFGCAGGGTLGSADESLFNLGQGDALNAIFGYWRIGRCRTDGCGGTKVGPCSICEGCERVYSSGGNPVAKIGKKAKIKSSQVARQAKAEQTKTKEQRQAAKKVGSRAVEATKKRQARMFGSNGSQKLVKLHHATRSKISHAPAVSGQALKLVT